MCIIKKLLTPLNRVLEKLIVPQLVKNFSTFYGTPTFVTTFTRAYSLAVP
jgi:hypothetical protein